MNQTLLGEGPITLLRIAVSSEKVSATRVLLENGANATPRILASAVLTGCVELCQLLLDHGIPIDAYYVQAGQKMTALSAAVLDNQVEVARWLLRRGADPNLFGRIKPLECAISEKNVAMVRCLIEGGAHLNAQNVARRMGEDWSTLSRAIMYYSPDVFDELLKDATGIDVNVPVQVGSKMTNLHFAVLKGGIGNAVKKLLERGANPSTEDEMGRTPFQLACEQGHLDCIYELFRGNPADYLAIVREVRAPMRAGSRKRRRIE